MKINIKFFIVFTFALFLFSCKKDKVINKPTPPDTYHTGLDISDSDYVKLWSIADTSQFYKLRLQGFPPEFALSMPEAEDQGLENSCTSFALSYCQAFYLKELLHLPNYNFNDKTIFSPEFLHNATSSGGACDKTGRSVSLIADYMLVYGVCSWNKMPYYGTDSCAGGMPDAAQTENAAFFKIKDHYMVQLIEPFYIKYLLAEKNTPVIIGVYVDKGFQDDGKNNRVFTWDHAHGEPKGGHAMVICGWSDAKHAYKVLNSYSKYWGDNGYAWIDYDYLKSVLVWDQVALKSAFIIKPDIDSMKIRPQIITTTPLYIDTTSARLYSSMTSPGADDITERGFYYGKDINTLTKVNVSNLTDPLFFLDVTNLEPDTHYEVISFAKNVYGTKYDTLEGGFRTKPSNNSDCPSTVTDIDGNVYHVVKIGTQCWLQENLKTTRFNDGSLIGETEDSIAWVNKTSSAWCYYNKDAGNNTPYGKLYNEYAISTKLCPVSYHIPDTTEWRTLVDFLGGEEVAGDKMKTNSFEFHSGVTNTNSSGFTGLPAGIRQPNHGEFDYKGQATIFWLLTSCSSTTNCFFDSAFELSYYYTRCDMAHYTGGFSVRCIKD